MHELSTKTVSVVMPAYKEEEYIIDTIEDVVGSLRARALDFEIIIVLDVTPEDKTVNIVRREAEKFQEIRLVERIGKRGVGDAIRAGIGLAEGKIVIPVMADHSETGSDLLRLIDVALEGYDMTVADRFGHGKPSGYPILKYVSNRILNVSARFLLMLPISDITNAFKAYRRESLSNVTIRSKGFEIFLELPVKTIRLRNSRTATVEANHVARRRKESKLSLFREGPKYAKLLFSLFIHPNPRAIGQGGVELPMDNGRIKSVLGRVASRKRMHIVRSLIAKKMAILDLGCGTGWLVKLLRGEGYMVIGVDTNLPDADTSSYLLRRSAYETGFADNAFDCIICLETIEHLEPRVYTEIKRISNNGARLLVTTPKKRWNWLVEILSRVGLSSPLVTPHINCVDPPDIPFDLEVSRSFMFLEWYGIYTIRK